MAFNLGAFAGGAAKGVEQGEQEAQQARQMKQQRQLKQDIAALPAVGAKNSDGSTVTQDQYNQALGKVYAQDTGDAKGAIQMQLQGNQGNYYGAEAEGKKQTNEQTSDANTALKNIAQHQQEGQQLIDNLASGKASATDVVKYGAQHGMQITENKDGSLTSGGHTIAANDITGLTGLTAVASQYGIYNTLRGAGIVGNQIANQNQQTDADTTRAGAAATSAAATKEDADTRQTMAPSEIARNQGQANQSNAEATIGIPANANNANADAGLRSAQTQGANISNEQNQGALNMQQGIATRAKQDPNYVGSPQYNRDVATLGTQGPPSVYGGYSRSALNDATRLQTTQMNNQGRATVAQIRTQGDGKGGARFKQSSANPNIWVDSQNPSRSVVTDPKTGAVTRIGGLQAPQGTAIDQSTGLPTASSKGQGAYLRADGQWDTDPNSALASYAGLNAGPSQSQAGLGQGQQGGAIQAPPPPLVNGQIPQGDYSTAALPGLPTQ
jgi:hypothetical protein